MWMSRERCDNRTINPTIDGSEFRLYLLRHKIAPSCANRVSSYLFLRMLCFSSLSPLRLFAFSPYFSPICTMLASLYSGSFMPPIFLDLLPYEYCCLFCVLESCTSIPSTVPTMCIRYFFFLTLVASSIVPRNFSFWMSVRLSIGCLPAVCCDSRRHRIPDHSWCRFRGGLPVKSGPRGFVLP